MKQESDTGHVVRHARLIHFALLATALVLASGLIAQEQPLAKNYTRNVHEIAHISRQWRYFQGHLHSSLHARLGAHPGHYGWIAGDILGEEFECEVAILPGVYLVPPLEEGTPQNVEQMEPPHSIEAMEGAWFRLSRSKTLWVVGEVGSTILVNHTQVYDEKSQSWVSMTRFPIHPPDGKRRATCFKKFIVTTAGNEATQKHSAELLGERPYTPYFGMSHSTLVEGSELTIPHSVSATFSLVLKDTNEEVMPLFNEFFGVSHEPKDFEFEFPGVAKLPKSVRTTEIEELESQVGEAESSEPHAKLLGILVPTRMLRWAGALAVLVVQFYLLVTLQVVATRMRPVDPAFDVAWIGIYPAKTAWISTLLTMLALPPLVLLLSGLFGGSISAVSLVAVVPSIVIDVFTYQVLADIRGRVRAHYRSR